MRSASLSKRLRRFIFSLPSLAFTALKNLKINYSRITNLTLYNISDVRELPETYDGKNMIGQVLPNLTFQNI